ncbi:hypothetical protein V4762_00640 [Thermodesulfobium sp. 4217-1]|uniref:hypothetical protein n=1 Tax=Thermodesulfobium sp. 4217-1 TaxID=3120013 RepID=UPI003221552B
MIFLSGWSGFREAYPEISEKCKYIVPFQHEGFLEGYLDEIRQEEDLLVGWSLGASLIIRNIDKLNAKKIILIAPFLNFTDYVDKRIVDLMSLAFKKNKDKCVIDFWSKIGLRKNIETRISKTLQNGLLFLKEKNNFDELYHKKNILIIAPVNDSILPFNAFLDVHNKVFGDLLMIDSNHYVEEPVLKKIVFGEHNCKKRTL